MKIVLVNTVYGSGSVGRITADLYEAVNAREDGWEALAAVGRGSLPEGVEGCIIGSRPDFLLHVWHNFLRDGSGFGSAGRTKRFIGWLERLKPDLLHLHNLHGFYLQVELLFEYIKQNNVPVVWTLHDCWPYTGHCAYYDMNGCGRWQEGCGNCRYHRSSYPYALFADRSRENYRRKEKAFRGVERLLLVTPSEWLKAEAGRSFLKDYPVRVLPNGIDLDIFSPPGKGKACGGFSGGERICREGGGAAELAGPKRYEILGAANVWEERKGLAYFEELAGLLPGNFHITLLGLNARQRRRLAAGYSGERLTPLGHTDHPEELAEAYRRADVFVNPTLEDNFPTANLEALACGAPVVTFRTGGSPETIDEGCGIAVEKGNAARLAEAVTKVCEGRRQGTGYSAGKCRERALRYSKQERYRQYLELYREMAGGGE